MNNLAEALLDHNLAARAEKVALRWNDVCFTFAECHTWSNKFGNALRALGVREEDRVMLFLPDVPAFAFAWFGVVRIGAVVVMVNPLVTAEDVAYYVRYSRARAVVTTRALADEHAELFASVPVIAVDRDVTAIDAQPSECPSGDTTVDDPAVWLFSSGSSGKPKACVHTTGDFLYNIEHYAKGVLGIREHDVTLAVPRLFFGYATGTNLLFPWAVGATTCLYDERPTAETVIAKIAEFRPTILTNVPTMIHKMLESPACAEADLSSVRLVLSAGEALPAELYRRWVERTGVEILDGIGSAELFHVYLSNRPGDVRMGTLGKPVPGYALRIVDGEGNVVPEGEIGTLEVHGPSNAIGYHRDRAKSRHTFRGEWTHTGDQFRVDADGYYVYCGRADDLLKVGGIYVSPVEVENCLMTHPQVREAAIIGFERDGLTQTAAFVVPVGEGTEVLAQELQAYVKTTLAPHKYPRLVRFLEDFPRNDRGKVARAALRATLLTTQG
jgi:benzoate-CoA ligase family protein